MKICSILLFISIFILIFVEITASQTPPPGRAIQSAEVYFDFGKHALRPVADSTLGALAALFSQKENLQIRITAHTDYIGSLANNLALSKRRAAAVRDFLVAQGVPTGAIYEMAPFGETKPLASNATDEGRQLNRRATVELYEPIEMSTLEGKVTDPKTGRGVVAEVIVHGKDFRDSLQTDTTGFFQTQVPTGEVFGVDVVTEGYFLESKMLKALPGRMPLLEIPLRPAVAGEVADIENLFFVGNQAVLLKKSEPVLPKILRFMQVNKTLKIEIAGHVNHPNQPPVGRDSWEFDLSERRARLVYHYLIGNGISPDRLSWKGYGNWEMRYPWAYTLQEQAANRRVEIRVVE